MDARLQEEIRAEAAKSGISEAMAWHVVMAREIQAGRIVPLSAEGFDPNQPRDEDGKWVAYGDRGAVIEDPVWEKREKLADSLDSGKAKRIIEDVAKRNNLKIEGPDWDLPNPYKVKMGKAHRDEVRAAIKAPDAPRPAPVRTAQIWDDDNPTGRPTDQYGRRM